jgi:hypothetical protein
MCDFSYELIHAAFRCTLLQPGSQVSYTLLVYSKVSKTAYAPQCFLLRAQRLAGGHSK